MKSFLVILVLLILAGSALAESVTLSWDAASGATGYKLYMTTDGGTTWTSKDVGAVTQYEWADVPLGVKVEWRISAYNIAGENINTFAWVSWDSRLKLPSLPVGFGLK